MSWVASLDLPLLDRRLGAAVVDAALAGSRIYVDPPTLDPAGRLAASVVDATTGRLHAPFKLAVRLSGDVVEASCACRAPGVCPHVAGVLVDVAADRALRDALANGDVAEVDPAARARALEERTLDERLAQWLPGKATDDFELDVECVAVPRPSLLLRHRARGSRAVIPARDVLAARLSQARRSLVELTAPHHAEKNALVATRGSATVLIQLLRDVIGLRTAGFKEYVRYGDEPLRPAVAREGDRLVARWGDVLAADALVFAGPFPHLWVPSTCTFHPIARDVDLDAAVGMQNVPSLPLGPSAERVGRAVLVRGRGLGVALPEPEVFGLPPLDAPSFQLRLQGSPLDVRGELVAIYAVGRVVVGETTTGPDLLRDDEAEANALARLAEVGLRSRDGQLVAQEEDAVRLWTEIGTLPFEVVLSSSLARTQVGPPVTLDIRLQASAGWLETEMEFRAGALKVEIARLQRALVDHQRWVVLDDGTLAKLEDEVATLVGALEGDRLPPHQIGRVLRDWDGKAPVRVFGEPPPLEARVPALAAELRPYQRVGLAWLQRLRAMRAGGLLADDMGLGKTLTTLAFVLGAVEDGETRPSLVVCPTSVVGNWLREAARFTPRLRVSADRDARNVDLLVLSYGLLRRDVTKLAKTHFACVVLDEAQNIKNAGSETARAARKLAADVRLALSGTPVENRLGELWSIMHFVNPGMLGTAADFDRRYEKPIAAMPDGAAARELRALVRPFVLRRRKEDVLLELPPKTEMERACIFDRTQRRLYDALSVAVRRSIATKEAKHDGALNKLTVLTAILRLRQMACDPRLVDPSVPAEHSAKRLEFLDLVRELVAERRRALVFSQFTSLFELWRPDLDEAHIAYEVLDGSTPPDARDAIVKRFQEGSATLFLVSLKAGGTGLNLTAADTVIHCDPWWNPAAEDQATDRAHRLGQTRGVTVVRLVARGTIEDKIGLLKRDKRELAGAVLAEPERLGALEEEDLALLLGPADPEG